MVPLLSFTALKYGLGMRRRGPVLEVVTWVMAAYGFSAFFLGGYVTGLFSGAFCVGLALYARGWWRK